MNLKDDEIISYEEYGVDETWDLEVDSLDHTFFANNISVSNSHSVCYSIISFQCAYFLTYYPEEWLAAYLDTVEKPKEKEEAINIAKSFGFNIKPVDINISTNTWEIDKQNKSFIQPLTGIKGLGEIAYKEIFENRPFKTIEELLFNEKIKYNKFNKKALDVLCRSGALNSLIDKRFTGTKHFWASICANERPKTLKKFQEYIEFFKDQGNFSNDELIEFETKLAGNYPINKVVKKEIFDDLKKKGIPSISQYDPQLIFCWFIIRDFEIKKTKTGKDYLQIHTIDDQAETKKIKCWGYNPEKGDFVKKNQLIVSRLDYNEDYGFSCRSIRKNFKVIL